MPQPSAEAIERRRVARAEVARVNAARADQLATLLRSGLSVEEFGQVGVYADLPRGDLQEAWTAFTQLTTTAQIEALGQPGFSGLPWHSLLQCNPYARLARWTPVALRAYA